MSQTSQKVQFFHSESSFGSESELSDSRYYDFTNEIIAETDKVFHTLREDLIPTEADVKWDKINYILSRGRLMHQDTIPEHISYLRRIQAPGDAQRQVEECSERLKRLFEDYQQYKSKTMIYKQFYNLYSPVGVGLQGGFSRKKEAFDVSGHESVLEPECVQINYNTARTYNATPRVILPSPATAHGGKQLSQLKHENKALRQKIEQNKVEHEKEINQYKLQFQRRLQRYLVEGGSNPNAHAVEQSKQLEQHIQKNNQLLQKIEDQHRAIENLKVDNASLNSQVEVLRKLELDLAEEKQHDISVHSIDVNEGSDRKTGKRMRNLLQENKLLKSQIKTERQKQYRLASELTQDEKSELDRNRLTLQRKNKELQEAYEQLDRARIELLQLQHTNRSDKTQNQSLKKENVELKTSLSRASQAQQERVLPLPATVSRQSLEFSRNNGGKVQVEAYEGDGIEGYPYYELLNKQFRIRFRRACLRDKQLLYKANGIEIGVISRFERPNILSFTLFITNCGNQVQDEIRVLKGKVMNANQNHIQGGNFEFERIKTNDQVKASISMAISRYPLGPLILRLEYSHRSKQQLRILLPAHIFKVLRVEERIESLSNPKNFTVSSQRKIAKDLSELKGYLQGVQPRDNRLKLAFHHEQTHSVVFTDIVPSKDGFQISYQHSSGNEHISEYFIKTLAFLIRK